MRPRTLLPGIVMLGWLVTGCGSDSTSGTSGGATDVPVPPVTTSRAADATSVAPTVPPTVPSSASPSASPSVTADPATDVLLAQQITLLAAGDGAVPDCAADLGRIPGAGEVPAVWIGNIRGRDRVLTPDEVALCLNGFAPGEPVEVTVTAGGKQYTTTARPASSGLTSSTLEPSDSLFAHRELTVHELGNGVLQSEKWWFVPPDTAREDLAAAGELTIRATQGALSARHSHPVELPDRPDRMRVDEGSHRILVHGFEPGTRLPVGLYAADASSNSASLVRQIGTVVMPRSRTAVFTVPAAVVEETRGKGVYCVTVPMEAQYNCPAP
ncbi:hypothetical protein ACFY7H_14325 [Streptomyces sp. NPDC012794]|uniref:hypothetical protein n=1 Tax=Streptomyces sp. NPDC012794 TaxID=3364850 RepID=UPI0036BB36B7